MCAEPAKADRNFRRFAAATHKALGRKGNAVREERRSNFIFPFRPRKIRRVRDPAQALPVMPE
jgi:hypothetical protein